MGSTAPEGAMGTKPPPERGFLDCLLDFLMCVDSPPPDAVLDDRRAVNESISYVSQSDESRRTATNAKPMPRHPEDKISPKPPKAEIAIVTGGNADKQSNNSNKPTKKKKKKKAKKSSSDASEQPTTRATPSLSQGKKAMKPKGSFIKRMTAKIDERRKNDTQTVRVRPEIAQILAEHPSVTSMDDLRALVRLMGE
jgi:hypothetical protein